MALDITLLRVLKNRKDFEQLRRGIPMHVLDPATETIINDFGQWFKENPDAAAIDFESFPLFLKLNHKKLTPEEHALLAAQVRKAQQDVTENIRAGIALRLQAADTAAQLEKLVLDYQSGDVTEAEFARRMEVIKDVHDTVIAKAKKSPFVDMSFDEMLDEEEDDGGYRWRTPILNKHMRPLRHGDFVGVALRVDSGKTSFIADNITYMAPQTDPERGGVHWFNNEGPGRKIVGRIRQAALNMHNLEMVEARHNGVNLQEAYAAAVGGSDRIRVVDIHEWSTRDVEEHLAEHQPCIVVFDMIDNIHFDGQANHGGQRTDQILEALYQWARLMGVKYDCAILATSQTSADADGLTTPALHMLKDSKTGKQGAMDACIILGRSNSAALDAVRFVNIPKNKLARPDAASDPRGYQLFFDSKRSRFYMPDDIPDHLSGEVEEDSA